jgi:hypothetical protein
MRNILVLAIASLMLLSAARGLGVGLGRRYQCGTQAQIVRLSNGEWGMANCDGDCPVLPGGSVCGMGYMWVPDWGKYVQVCGCSIDDEGHVEAGSGCFPVFLDLQCTMECLNTGGCPSGAACMLRDFGSFKVCCPIES